MSQQSFADLGVSRAVCTALSKRGFESPFAIQKLVVADVLAGNDVLAKSPTGSGKTLAFGVPLMDRIEANDRRPAALILAPTRELATQIVDELRDVATARALSICAVYGGAGIQKQTNQARKSHIIVATPGRLEDLLARRAFTLQNIQVLVLDEADRMLDMGFRPVMDRIVAQCPERRQTLLFSATLDGEAGRIAAKYTRRDAATHEHVPEVSAKPDTEHRFVKVLHEAKVDQLISELDDRDRGLALVFVRTKRGADRLVKRLGSRHVDAVAMHGDKSQGQRERALARFERGDVDVLVATDVAARGIDVEGVTHVINYDAPEDREGYVHRTGRTGRAGRRGIGITFVMHDQAKDIGRIARDLGLHAEFAHTGFGGGATSSEGERRGPAKGHRGSRPTHPRGQGQSQGGPAGSRPRRRRRASGSGGGQSQGGRSGSQSR